MHNPVWNARKNGKQREIHDCMVTDIELYTKEEADYTNSTGLDGQGELHRPRIDKRLLEWFCYVKRQDIKIELDTNGEPVFPIQDKARQ